MDDETLTPEERLQQEQSPFPVAMGMPMLPPRAMPGAAMAAQPTVAMPTPAAPAAAAPAPPMAAMTPPPTYQPPAKEIPATQKLWNDTAKPQPGGPGIQNGFLRGLARTGAGILRGADIIGETAFPRIAEFVPGSNINTGLRNAANQGQAEKQQAMAMEGYKAGTEQQKAMTEQEKADTDAKKQPAMREPKSVTPGDYVEQSDGTFKQIGTPKEPKEAEKSYEHATIADPANPKEGKEALFDKNSGQYLDPDTKQPIAGARPFEKPEEGDKPLRQLVEVPVDPNDPSKGTRIIEAHAGATLPQGARTPAQMGQVGQTEQTRADMAENVDENLDRLEDIVNRRPDLFGKLAGRMTKAREIVGTSDPDIAMLKQIGDNFGRAMTAAHSMRNGSLVESATNGILNSYNNGPDAIKAAIKTARGSVKTFTGDVERKTGNAGAAQQQNQPIAGGFAAWKASQGK